MDNNNTQAMLSAFPPEEPIPQKKKRKDGAGMSTRLLLLLVLTLELVLALAVLTVIHSIHFREITQEGLRECRICSAIDAALKEQSADGEEEMVQSTGIYTVLGQTNPKSTVRLTHNVHTGVLSVYVPGDELFIEDTISIWDYRNKKMDADTYSVTWDGDTALITLPEDMAPGLYSIHSGYQGRLITKFYFGEYYIPMPAASAVWIEDFAAESRQTGRYLYRADGQLWTGDELNQAMEFQSTWWLSAVDFSGREMVLRSGETDFARFECDEYVQISEGMRVERFYVLRYEDAFLASNARGEVYLTQKLTNACFWYTVYL